MDEPQRPLLDEGKGDQAQSSPYEALEACAKQQLLWERGILPTRYAWLPPFDGSGGWSDLVGLAHSAFSLKVSFDRASDQMPERRVKFIHRYGAVAEVTWIADEDSPYTGMYAEPAACGLARLSLAGDPDKIGYTPGMAIKLFATGVPSVNLHVMNALNGQGEDQNFFARPFSNIIPRPDGVLLRIAEAYFATAKRTPTHLNVDHLARLRQDGTPVASPRIPYQLVFAAGDKMHIDPLTTDDMRDELARVPAGSVLYDVWANDAEGADLRHIGRIVTTSEFVASRWGDEGLFFRHNR